MEQENGLSNFTLFIIAISVLVFGYYVLSGHQTPVYNAEMQNGGMEEAGVLNAMEEQQMMMGGYEDQMEHIMPEYPESMENMEYPENMQQQGF